jgi:hypothetical protein
MTRREMDRKRAATWIDEHTSYSAAGVFPPDDEEVADLIERVREESFLRAARAVDDVLVQIGALEGSTIHSALSAARRAVLALGEESSEK